MDHSVDLEADPVIRNHLIEIEHLMLDPIPMGLGLSERFDKQKLRHAYGVLRVNSFAIETIRGGKGRALFPMTALISHSCQPNVLHEPISYGSNEFHTNNQEDTCLGASSGGEDKFTNANSCCDSDLPGEIKMVLRSQRHIPKGTEVCISYVSIMQGKQVYFTSI